MQSALGAEVLKRIHLLKADEGEECSFVASQCDLECVPPPTRPGYALSRSTLLRTWYGD